MSALRMTPIFGKPDTETSDRLDPVYAIIYQVPGMSSDLQVSGRPTDKLLSDAFMIGFGRNPNQRKPLYRVKITPKTA